MSRVPALAYPVKPIDHAPLVTVADACAYMLALPERIGLQSTWQRAARLCLEAQQAPADLAAIAALTEQVDLALFLTGRLDIDGWKKPAALSVRRAGTVFDRRRA